MKLPNEIVIIVNSIVISRSNTCPRGSRIGSRVLILCIRCILEITRGSRLKCLSPCNDITILNETKNCLGLCDMRRAFKRYRS